MKLISLNVGLPREVPWHNTVVTTGIFKQPVSGRLALRKLNLDGDRQADLRVHGGEYKAVYCYPVEHYAYWKKELPGHDLPFAVFGENFTTQGLLEDSVHLGDRFAVGSAEVVVTQPRLPCYKLGVRFGSDEMVKRFLSSARTGFYLAVTREGEVGAGDEISLLSRDPSVVPVSEITRLYVAIHAAPGKAASTATDKAGTAPPDKTFSDADAAVVHRALKISAFPESWKSYLRDRLPKVNACPACSA